MEPVLARPGCYCCCRPSTRTMDVDLALNELGMLSSAMECRAQYIREKSRRAMTNIPLSRPSTSGTGQQGGYQIVSVNTKFVTGMSSASINKESSIHNHNALLKPSSSDSQLTTKTSDNTDQMITHNGYRQCEPPKPSRFSRLKLSRIRRFKKPYEVPWRLSHSGVCQENVNHTMGTSSGDEPNVTAPSVQESDVTPSSTPKNTTYISKSSSNTPEKPQSLRDELIHRSQSMDDLDVSKLRIAEFENLNYRDEQKEIEGMSQDMKDLQVTDTHGGKLV